MLFSTENQGTVHVSYSEQAMLTHQHAKWGVSMHVVAC